ncbi:MAG: DUF1501 domain-containing protein [Chloroflexi bacterium]|nr:DUF1501 domain-containing protein [Chloroflexota bacterium]
MTPTTLPRRSFLKLAASGMAAWTVAPTVLPQWMPRMAFAPPGEAPAGDILVCVFQRGGMDGLNAVVPHADPDYYRARPTLAIPEPSSGSDGAAIDLDGFFSLHPALRPLKDIWDAGHLAVVHACGSPDPTHSHFEAMDYMERGTPGEKAIPSGWLGRHLQIVAESRPNPSPFRAVGMGGILQASLRGPVPATALRSIADFHLQGREEQIAEIQATLASLYTLDNMLADEARTTFEALEILARIDPQGYQPANGAQYPESDYGFGLRQIAQIAKAEVGLEIACVDIGGWDTHANQGTLEGGTLPGLLTELGQGLAALYHDLRETGKGLTLVTMSEFGRRVEENASDGTDHGHGNLIRGSTTTGWRRSFPGTSATTSREWPAGDILKTLRIFETLRVFFPV